MCSPAKIKHYRLVQWELSKRIKNEILDVDPDYTFENITDREYRYECSIISCRSMRDLRMTPSGIFCASHYLPWLHLNANGNREKMKICYFPGCLEPPVSTRIIGDIDHEDKVFLCRNHALPPITDEIVAQLAENMCHINSTGGTLFGTPEGNYGHNSNLGLEYS